MPTLQNTLYYGDNLEVLRRYIKDESVDLIYLDPPFKSNQDYNVLFAEQGGTRSAAQIKAFEDIWHWDKGAALSYQQTVETGGKVAQAMQAFRQFLGENDMMAYLSMMAPRLVELRRVLKSTGSIYLHCDPTASHYLKILLDGVFGPKRFLNEITWKRSSAHSDTKQGMKRCGKIRDVLLVYTKADEYTWNPVYTPYTKEYLESEYRHKTKNGRYYKETDLTAAKPGGDTEYTWYVKRQKFKGAKWSADLEEEFKNPKSGWDYLEVKPYQGRYWAYSKKNLIQFAIDGILIHRETGMPRLVQFADKMPGIPLQDLWDDISPATGDEDLGYPTQKPEELLDRVIKSCSNEGDIILDPFCGCGTAISSAQRLKRHWIGIDITHLAITLIKHRLYSAFGKKAQYKVIGEPVDLTGAKELAQHDPYQFQWWSLGLVGARPTEQKKGADQGIDGRIYFFDEHLDSGKTKQIILSVKAGHTGPAHLRDLRGVVEREKAQIGVLISLETSTQAMRTEAAKAGFYERPFGEKGERYPRLQLLTIEELLKGKGIAYPAVRADLTFKKARKVEEEGTRNLPGRLPFGE